MLESSVVHRPHAEAPARARLDLPSDAPSADEDAARGARRLRFEIVSRGDIVPGTLWLPDADAGGSGPWPLVLLLHRAGESKDAPGLDPATHWVAAGLAVAGIDLPLHGERASPKLSARLQSGIRALAAGREIDAQTHVLVEEAARQSTSDAIRSLDALAALDEIAGDRLALVGMGIGAVVGCYLLAHDARARAAVLAGAGAGGGAAGPAGPLDPARWLRQARVDALLLIEDEHDERIGTPARAALAAAANGSVRRATHAARDGVWAAAAWAEMRDFLVKALRT